MRLPVRATLWCAAFLLGGASTSHAQLWRNGGFDGFSGLSSEINTEIADARVYDNFIASGSGWVVTSLFGEFLTDFQANQAYWEIRSGISDGLEGSLLHYGVGNVTGITDLGDAFGFAHLQYRIGGFSAFELPPGEYWLTIAPVGEGFGRAFVATTSGNGALHALGDQRSFWDSQDFGKSFVEAAEELEAFSDFSYGIEGFSSVPEPSSIILVGTGLVVMVIGVHRKRKSG